jgi:hypothetical protein
MSKTHVGKRPAASRPATQAQTQFLRQIATCPFCAWQYRKIHVDTAAMVAALAGHPKGLHILLHEHPDKRLFVFGDNGKPWPCPHVILAWGRCVWQPSDGTGRNPLQVLEFDMEHPCVTQTDHELEVFLKEQVATRTCGRRFLPSVPIRYRQVQKKWHQQPDAENPARDFEFEMRGYFTSDLAKLYTELPSKAAAFQQHRANVEAAGKR